MAAGIDTASHQGVLNGGGYTVAVMGTGHKHTFPLSNLGLRRRIIVAGGAVISQFHPVQGPSKTTFPARNNLIAGLSSASLLVKTTERSGTRIESRFARQQNKPVWLWGPTMHKHGWAHDWVESDHGVSFVDDVDEIVGRLEELAN